MLVIYAVGIWLNAWYADMRFRERRFVQASVAAAMAGFCFFMWARGVA